MGYIGNIPALDYISYAVQNFTVTAGTTVYTLDYSVSNENDIRLVINNVIQRPGASYGYSATGTTLTLTSATNAGDTMYAVFIGRAVQTVVPPAGSITNSMIASNAAISSTKLSISAPQITTYTSGSGTYTTPSDTKYLFIEMVGAGGGGGGGGDATAGFGAGGGGGGAGAYVRKILASPSATYSYAIGSAGTSSAKNVTGGTGGNTTFGSLTANGGVGGGAGGGINTIGAGGIGGTGSGGDLNLQGGAGFLGTVGASGSTQGTGGSGGQNQLGNSSNATGLSYGGGGNGGSGASSSSAGAAGFIIITAYF